MRTTTPVADSICHKSSFSLTSSFSRTENCTLLGRSRRVVSFQASTDDNSGGCWRCRRSQPLFSCLCACPRRFGDVGVVADNTGRIMLPARAHSHSHTRASILVICSSCCPLSRFLHPSF